MTEVIAAPPERPSKSKLRNSDLIHEDNSSSQYKSRFTEQFDFTPLNTAVLDSHKPLRPQQKSPLRPNSLKASQSSITVASSANRSDSELQLPVDLLTTTTIVSPKQRLKLSASKSTPLIASASNAPPLPSQSSGSLSIHSNYSKSQLTVGSLNRADLIISRLEGWHMCLKSVVAWLEEVSRLSMASSRGYMQRAYSMLDESCAKSSKRVQGQDSDEQVNDSILMIQIGLQTLTKQLAAQQKDMSRIVDKRFIPELTKLAKQVKEKMNKLKNNSALAMDELLRRAEVTRSKMAILNRCCKQAEKTRSPDPWLANLLVLRHLKHEIDEENRLRLLMIPVQQEAQEFEQKIMNALKPAVEYCYRTLAPTTWHGSSNQSATPFRLILEQLTPMSDWEKFVDLNKNDLIDENNPTKDYLKINYPNKFHPLVMTVVRGTLEKRLSVRKQFVQREFVLTQSGYLHEFTFGSKLTPEKTIYIPNATIVPVADIKQIVKDSVLLEYGHLDLTFDICKPSTNILQKDKVTTFRAANKADLVQWCLALISKSNSAGVSSESRESETGTSNNSSSFQSRLFSRNSTKRKTSTSTSIGSDSSSILHTNTKKQQQQQQQQQHQKEIAKITVEPTYVALASQDDTQLTPTTEDFPILSSSEDTNLMTDTESFVTARLKDESIYPEDDHESDTFDDFFSNADSDDDASINSNVTAKATVANGTLTDNTRFDDAQSSLYYSSQSRPPSPFISDDNSSIVSMPELNVPDQVESQ